MSKYVLHARTPEYLVKIVEIALEIRPEQWAAAQAKHLGYAFTADMYPAVQASAVVESLGDVEFVNDGVLRDLLVNAIDKAERDGWMTHPLYAHVENCIERTTDRPIARKKWLQQKARAD